MEQKTITKMKTLLVIPRYNLTNKINYDYPFPLGLSYIYSSIKNKGYEVDCLNLNHHNGTVEEIIEEKLQSKKYNVVCSGHTGMGYSVIEKIINICKNHNSKPKTIIGGPIVTSEPKIVFESLKPDFAVIGEGEITIIELLDSIENNKNLSEVKGIIYWKDNKLKITNPREIISDINILPIIDFKGMGFEEQLDNRDNFFAIDYPRIYPILASRGCPFRCTFCYHTLGERYRQRTIENVMEELRKNVKKYKINLIWIYDDLFSIDRERLFRFCDEIKSLLKELDWKCEWYCQLTVRNLDKEMIRKLKSSGCNAVSFGFESYSNKVLKSMNKPITPEMIDKAIKLCLQEKITFQGNFIFGDTAETTETAKETLDYWRSNCEGQVRLFFIEPYPGSQIYKNCIEKGVIKDKLQFIKNNLDSSGWFNMTDNMTDEEVLKLKEDIFDARKKDYIYVVPTKIRKEEKPKRYTLSIKCPFCKEKLTYKNFQIEDRLIHIRWTSCKSCRMNIHIVSLLYKLGIKNYKKVEFLKNIYQGLKKKQNLNKL